METFFFQNWQKCWTRTRALVLSFFLHFFLILLGVFSGFQSQERVPVKSMTVALMPSAQAYAPKGQTPVRKHGEVKADAPAPIVQKNQKRLHTTATKKETLRSPASTQKKTRPKKQKKNSFKKREKSSTPAKTEQKNPHTYATQTVAGSYNTKINGPHNNVHGKTQYFGTLKNSAPFSTEFGNPNGPRFAQHVLPEYPHLSRRKGEEGIVRLRLHISASGKLLHAEVFSSAGSRLDKAALLAVQKSRFIAARLHNQPVECFALLSMHFILKED